MHSFVLFSHACMGPNFAFLKMFCFRIYLIIFLVTQGCFWVLSDTFLWAIHSFIMSSNFQVQNSVEQSRSSEIKLSGCCIYKTVTQLRIFDSLASSAKSMRVLLHLGPTWVNVRTTWVNGKQYNKSLRHRVTKIYIKISYQ